MCSYYIMSTEFRKDFTIDENKIEEYFYSPKEIRKLKLNKIKKSR